MPTMLPVFPVFFLRFFSYFFLVAVFGLTMATASAAPFNISGKSSSPQTLDAGHTGTVAAGAVLAVNDEAAAVSIGGDQVTLNNLGTIDQSGPGRAIRAKKSGAKLLINNGSAAIPQALIQSSNDDAIQVDGVAAGVTLNNYGVVSSLNAGGAGAQAVDFAGVAGANVINNYQGGVISAAKGDAVRPGVNGVVLNRGTIRSTPKDKGKSTAAIDTDLQSGIRIVNDSGGVLEGGRHGITGNQKDGTSAYTLHLTNQAGAVIRGSDGAGLNIDGKSARQLVTVLNHGSIIGTGVSGDGDGIDVDGMVHITNSGTIRSVNAVEATDKQAYSEGISAAGGTIVNTGTIEGLVAAGNSKALGRGITLAGNDTDNVLREGIYGDANITNQAGGLIRGDSDSAIVAAGAASGFTITINNHAGATIVGGGAGQAAILTAHDSTVIVNAGTIDGRSSGKALAMGSANNRLVISGGKAALIGSIDGGVGGNNSLLFDAGPGNKFSYDGAIANFNSVGIDSGDIILSGQSSYSGDTIVKGGSLTLIGARRIASASALVLEGGVFNVAQIGAGQGFASLSLLGNATIQFKPQDQQAQLTFNGLGTVAPGKTLTLTGVGAATGAGLRFVGDIGRDASFLALMRALRTGDVAVTASFDGTHTNVAQTPKPGSVAQLDATSGR